MSNKHIVFGMVVALIIVGVFSAQYMTSGSEITENEATRRIKNEGTLRVGIDPTYPPMESRDNNGKMIGYDIDVAGLIAEALEVELELIEVPWDDFFPAVNRGDVDMVISSITITPDRSEIVTFSNPYFSSGQVIVVRASDQTIVAPEDMNGKAVAAQADTTSLQGAMQYAGADNVYVYESTYDESIMMLQEGQLDALVIDFPAGANIVQTFQGLKLAGDPFTSEFYGIAVALGNDDFVRVLNEIISRAKVDGALDALQTQWLE